MIGQIKSSELDFNSTTLSNQNLRSPNITPNKQEVNTDTVEVKDDTDNLENNIAFKLKKLNNRYSKKSDSPFLERIPENVAVTKFRKM